MLVVFLSLFMTNVEAQDLSELRELSRFNHNSPIFTDEKSSKRKVRKNVNKYEAVFKKVGLEEIISSPEELGVLKPGTYIYNLDSSKKTYLDKDIFIRFHRLPDEQGFKYLVTKDGDIKYKVDGNHIHSIAQETVMYEPPHSYTPAPERKIIHWDKSLKSKFELGVGISMMRAHFLQDLLNLDSTPNGQMNQFGASYLADWQWPVKVGLGINYQKAQFKTDGETSSFSSLSIGPIFKSKNFYPYNIPLRLHTQISYSPFAQMDVNISRGSTGFDFNATDFVAGIEFPLTNQWGEFVISFFTQYQWLRLKNQDEIVNIDSSNKPNQAVGLGLSQVF